jgi:hypothetical protein
MFPILLKVFAVCKDIFTEPLIRAIGNQFQTNCTAG